MLGHTLFAHLSTLEGCDVYATTRASGGLNSWFPENFAQKVRTGVDADNFDTVIRALASIRPDIVINCIGLIKQLPISLDPLTSISVNSLLPHRISLICRTAGTRLIHFSTDCVFNGQKGKYTERDPSNAEDLYGRTKFLGEVIYPNCITIRTSIIGHELKGFNGLIEWYFQQGKRIKGFRKAIFSGFPTIELANIIGKFIIPNDKLKGLYHVSSQPISKYELLKLVARRYQNELQIEPYDNFEIDRSLDSTIFQRETQYTPPSWLELVDKMYDNFTTAPHYQDKRVQKEI